MTLAELKETQVDMFTTVFIGNSQTRNIDGKMVTPRDIKMSDVLFLQAATEGCEICSFLAKNKVSVLACVATDYGSKSLKEGEYLKIHAGRLNGAENGNLLNEPSGPDWCSDATHP